MEHQDLIRCKSLNQIPIKKLHFVLESIDKESISDKDKMIKKSVVIRYYESNIPVEYWRLKMDRDFEGDPRLLEKYSLYTKDIKTSYINGSSICFCGNHGLGKTMTSCCVLKKAVATGFTCLYSTLSDIVNILIQSPQEEKFLARKELNMVDFLVIDEFDSRFMSNDNAAELYGKTLEGVFRTRCQNKLPTIMCTNSPNIVKAFNGALKESIDSLTKGYLEEFPVFGEDFRKKK